MELKLRAFKASLAQHGGLYCPVLNEPLPAHLSSWDDMSTNAVIVLHDDNQTLKICSNRFDLTWNKLKRVWHTFERSGLERTEEFSPLECHDGHRCPLGVPRDNRMAWIFRLPSSQV